MDTDEIDPPRPVLKPLDLQALSVAELQAYIGALKAEMARAEAMIESKNNQKASAADLFRF